MQDLVNYHQLGNPIYIILFHLISWKILYAQTCLISSAGKSYIHDIVDKHQLDNTICIIFIGELTGKSYILDLTIISLEILLAWSC